MSKKFWDMDYYDQYHNQYDNNNVTPPLAPTSPSNVAAVEDKKDSGGVTVIEGVFKVQVFSNLGPWMIAAMEREKKRKEEEEKKRKEEEEAENMRIYGYRWPNDFMKKHKQDYIDGKYHGYMSEWSAEHPYGYSPQYSGYNKDPDYLDIYFFEWSDIDRKPKEFHSKSNFLRFCADNSIEVPSFTKTEIEGFTNKLFIMCPPGRKDMLLFGPTKYALQADLDRWKLQHPDWEKSLAF